MLCSWQYEKAIRLLYFLRRTYIIGYLIISDIAPFYACQPCFRLKVQINKYFFIISSLLKKTLKKRKPEF